MLTVVGNNKREINREEFLEIISGYEKVVLDMGAGDGRFIYKNALANKDNFYLGIDPGTKQFEKFLKRAIRKKLANILFIQGSVEIFPPEIKNTVDKIFIILPWGTLLKEVILPSEKFLSDLLEILKDQGEIEIVVGYSKDLEPSESERLELPEISEKYIKNKLIPKYSNSGFKFSEFYKLQKNDLKNLESTWSKKLAFGKERNIFKLAFLK